MVAVGLPARSKQTAINNREIEICAYFFELCKGLKVSFVSETHRKLRYKTL